MILINFFLSRKKSNTADIAKKRLQSIVTQRKKNNKDFLNFLPSFKKDILKAINQYVIVESHKITFQIEKKKQNSCILNFNIILLDNKK
ncbi:cell division topological specificity factor MinE [Candidatus Tachikawaea gelatinosa]|nr:cell division topological specificity factor MinE [Candidatus Tachikawaea gelatinosa]